MRDKSSFREATRKIKLVIEELAITKMWYLVHKFDTEVGWHGFAERLFVGSTKTTLGFCINDIVIYPQMATGATITTDQDEYEDWLSEMPDDKFCKIRSHGHSHVNMSTEPSFVDEKHQDAIVSDLCDDDFYIFIIMNKRGEFFIRIFDLAEDTVYENENISLITRHSSTGLLKFMIAANEAVETLHVDNLKYQMRKLYREDGAEDGCE